jgi:hypothetical protein
MKRLLPPLLLILCPAILVSQQCPAGGAQACDDAAESCDEAAVACDEAKRAGESVLADCDTFALGAAYTKARVLRSEAQLSFVKAELAALEAELASVRLQIASRRSILSTEKTAGAKLTLASTALCSGDKTAATEGACSEKTAGILASSGNGSACSSKEATAALAANGKASCGNSVGKFAEDLPFGAKAGRVANTQEKAGGQCASQAKAVIAEGRDKCSASEQSAQLVLNAEKEECVEGDGECPIFAASKRLVAATKGEGSCSSQTKGAVVAIALTGDTDCSATLVQKASAEGDCCDQDDSDGSCDEGNKKVAFVSLVTTIRCDKAKARLSAIAKSMEQLNSRIVVQRNLITGARSELFGL